MPYKEAYILVDFLQDSLGDSVAAFVLATVAAAPGAEVAGPAVVEEKTKFNVLIDEVPTSTSITTINVIRVLTNLALKEGKDLIEGLPKKFREAMMKEEAKEQHEEVVASVVNVGS